MQRSSDYFEGIIQLRDVNDEIVQYVLKQIVKHKIDIAKSIEHKNGVDFYVSSQRFARALGRRLKRVFNGEMILSNSLFGISKKTGKTVYRITMCFRGQSEDL